MVNTRKIIQTQRNKLERMSPVLTHPSQFNNCAELSLVQQGIAIFVVNKNWGLVAKQNRLIKTLPAPVNYS